MPRGPILGTHRGVTDSPKVILGSFGPLSLAATLGVELGASGLCPPS